VVEVPVRVDVGVKEDVVLDVRLVLLCVAVVLADVVELILVED